MRLLEITQKAIFKEPSESGMFIRGDEVIFSGYVRELKGKLTGYMRQKNDKGNGIYFYVKGNYEAKQKELILFAVTHFDCKYYSPMAVCSYFENFNGKGVGFLDDTDGIPSKSNGYFFIEGDYIARTELEIKEVKYNDEIYKTVRNRMRRTLYKLGKYEESKSFYLEYEFCYFFNFPKDIINCYPK